MATHKQAEKRHRQSLKREARNNYFESTLRGLLKSARTALTEGKNQGAAAAVQTALSWVDHVAVKGIIPRGRADRLKSRLASQLAKHV